MKAARRRLGRNGIRPCIRPRRLGGEDRLQASQVRGRPRNLTSKWTTHLALTAPKRLRRLGHHFHRTSEIKAPAAQRSAAGLIIAGGCRARFRTGHQELERSEHSRAPRDRPSPQSPARTLTTIVFPKTVSLQSIAFAKLQSLHSDPLPCQALGRQTRGRQTLGRATLAPGQLGGLFPGQPPGRRLTGRWAMIQCLRRCPVTIHTRPSGRSTHRSPMAQPPRRKRSNDKIDLEDKQAWCTPSWTHCRARDSLPEKE